MKAPPPPAVSVCDDRISEAVRMSRREGWAPGAKDERLSGHDDVTV